MPVGGVFTNYRGEDSHSYGALIYSELSRRFGGDLVFLDSESIRAGEDFVEILLDRLRQCSVLLVVIGQGWLAAADKAGRRRIDSPEDWVRRELMEAFAHGLRVIPILTDGVQLPDEADLPADIAALHRRQALRLHHRNTSHDLARIVEELIRSEPDLAEAARRCDGVLRQPPLAPELAAELTAITPPIAQFHVQRREAQDALATGFARSNTVAIVGISGCGKTQIALDYLNRFSESYTFCWWVRADDPAMLQNDLATLGRYIGVHPAPQEGSETLAQRVRLKLQGTPGWLLVVDNAPGPDVNAYIPSAGGHVLFTSQNSAWPGERYKVPPFTTKEAASVIHAATADTNDIIVKKIVELTSGHPLALAQAASYIAMTAMDPNNYVRLLGARRAELLARGEIETHATLHASVLEICCRLTPSARELLDLFGAVAPAPITLMPLAPDPDIGSRLPSDELLLEDAIAELRSFSLLERDGLQVLVHELVQEIVRASLDQAGQLKSLMTVVSLVLGQLPERVETADAWQTVEHLLPHALHLADQFESFEKLPATASTFFLNRIAPYFQARGEPHRAEVLLRRASKLLEGKRDNESRAAHATILTNLATLESDRGNLDTARQLHEQALAIKDDVLNPNDLSVAVSLSGLAVVNEQRDELGSARTLYERALPIYRQSGDAARTADCLTDLARISVNQHDYPAAASYASQAVEVATGVKSAWPDLANAHLALARISEAEDDLPAAVRHAREAERVCRQTGVDSKELTEAMSLRGRLLVEMGVTDHGIGLLRHSLTIFRHLRADVTIDAARTEGNLGAALMMAGYVEDAYSHLRRSHDEILTLVQPEHPTAITSRALLLQCCVLLNHESEARALFDELEGQPSQEAFLARFGLTTRPAEG